MDRLLALSAGVLGIVVFILTLHGVRTGHAWELPIGIAALVAGLVGASFVAYRGRPR